MNQCQQIFDILYSNVNGALVSHKDRADLKEDIYGLVYGEITFESFADMLALVQPKTGEVFYDLGSGAGKAVFCSALLYDWKKCCGIELLPGLYQLSMTQLEKFNTLPEVKTYFPNKQFPIQFINSNILQYDFSDADVIFINATSFSTDFWNSILEKLNRLKIGTRIILNTKQLSQPEFQLLDGQMRLMSWGMNSAYTYLKIA